MNYKDKEFYINNCEDNKTSIIDNKIEEISSDILNNELETSSDNMNGSNSNDDQNDNNNENISEESNIMDYEDKEVRDTIFDLYYAVQENPDLLVTLGVDEKDLKFTVGLPDVLFVLTTNNNYVNEKNVPLISKICIVRELREIELLELSTFLHHVGIDILNIVSINYYVDKEEKNIYLQKIIKPTRINHIQMNVSQFIEHTSKPYFNFLENNINTIYILKGGSYMLIKDLFNKIDNGKFHLGKGGLQKSHMLSHLDIRFTFYLMAMFNFNFKLINYLNTFNDIPKHRYLPYIDNTGKYKTSIIDNKVVRKLVSKTNNKDVNLLPKGSKSYHTLPSKESSNEKNIKSNESPIFSYLDQIESIVNNSKSLYHAQQEIEVSWITLMKERLEDPAISSWQMLPTLIKKSYITLEKAEAKGILKRRFKILSRDISLYKKDLAILTIGVLMSNYNRISKTNICIKLGNEIAFYLFKESRLKNQEGINKFNDWKKENELDSIKSLFKLGDYFVLLFTNEPTQLFEVDFTQDDIIDTNSNESLKVSPEYIESIKDTLYVHPTSLPMLSPPLHWSDNDFGGFIENKYDQNPIDIGNKIHAHKTDYKENLYKTVNSLNKTKFRINKDILDYVLGEGKFLLENNNDKHAFQNNITLKVAKIYSKYDFYLNLNSDWRTRLYTNSFFVSYQGGDLTKSLIEFAEGEVLNNDGLKYLYICCANLYSSIISKKSYVYRVSWVKKNLNKIISLDRNFIMKASKKIQFASICITIKKYHADNNYVVKTPIFLDATCSGIQHLAAMLQDINMGTHVNLISKTEKDDVADLYETIVEPTNKAINKYGDENPLHKNLMNVKLSRKILKPSIMTTVYAVTVSGIFNQLKKQFEKNKVIHPTDKTKDGKPKYNHFYVVPSKKGKDLLLSYSDVYKIAEIVKNEAFNVYPKLRDIYDYFINTTRLLVKLNLPVVWFTPSGAEITQFYVQQDVKKVSLNNFGKTRKRVYREPNNLLDKSKQSQAIIPNIIHSLDASHLISVICYAYEKDLTPIITVHDCFGTLPNKMERLSQIVRSQFALLYTNENFLEKYNNRVIDSIVDNNYEIIEKNDKNYVIHYEIKESKDGKRTVKNKLTEIPMLPEKGSLDLKKIIKAIYLIS